MFKLFKDLGPATLVSAAFVGPGTVTVCAAAGIGFGYALLWALVVSIVMTILLQELAARIGIVTQKGLADVLRDQLPNQWLKIGMSGLILAAIVVGNSAYEAGNISGAVLGLEAIFGPEQAVYFPFLVGVIAFLMLYFGNIKQLSNLLIGLVITMSTSFLIVAFMTGPPLLALLKGLLVPIINNDNIYNIIALVGTTVVPYNLFLHSALAKENWKNTTGLKAAKKDTIIAIVLGGLISLAIVVSAAGLPLEKLSSVLDLAAGLAPLYGEGARYLIGIGLFGAGISSAVTAPLAAAYVANSCFNWNVNSKHWKFRAVWMFVMGVGLLSLSFSFNPIIIIQFAQIANGILLPILVLALIWLSQSGTLLGKHKNSTIQNILYGIIFIFSLGLSLRTLFKILEM